MPDASTTILGQYSILSKPNPGGADNFDDTRLRGIARATGKGEEKVASIIAKFLLHSFSIDTSFSSKSSVLQRTYNILRERYLTIISDLREGREVEESKYMQAFLAEAGYLKNKKKLVNREILHAILASEEILSFPELYHDISELAQSEMQLPLDVNAQSLFRVIDKRASSPPSHPALRRIKRTSSQLPGLNQVQQRRKRLPRANSETSLPWTPSKNGKQSNQDALLACFFYKHVALYSFDNGEKKILTWMDLVEEWMQLEGVLRRNAYKFALRLPFNWLRPFRFSSSIPGKGSSFQTFVYHKTIELLEKRIAVKLDEEMRTMLIGKMQDENFRMHLIFYLGHMDYLIQKGPEKKDPAYRWLLAVRRFSILRNQFQFSSKYRPTLFRWVFDANSLPAAFANWDKECDGLPTVSPKRHMDFIIQGIVRLVQFFSDEENFRKKAFQFFAILDQYSTDLEGKLEFLQDLSRLKYCLVPEELIAVFLAIPEFDRNHFKANFLAVTRLLTDVHAGGQSDQFLRLFCYPGWDDEKVGLARQIVLQVGAEGIKVEEVLAIFLSVLQNSINRNFLTAANNFNKIALKGKKEVFAGKLPAQFHCEEGRMKEALQKTLEYQGTYHFTDVESFQFYLWILSQEKTVLVEKWNLLQKIEAFIGCRVEKELVLSLAQAPIQSAEILDALEELERLREKLLSDHATQVELPSEFCLAIQTQMDRILVSEQLEGDYFLVHPTREICKYISSGSLFFDLELGTFTRFLADYHKEIQMPFGQSSPTRRVIRGGWRLDCNPPVFELAFVNFYKNSQEFLKIPLVVDPKKIDNPMEFFQWVSEMAERVCSDLHPSSFVVPEKFARFEKPVQSFLEQLKLHLRMKVLLLAKPNSHPDAPKNRVDKCPTFSGDTCPKNLASQILQGKPPDIFPLIFDNGSQREERYVQCKVSEEDPFGFTLTLSVKDRKKLCFPVRYHRALVKKEEDLKELLQQQIAAFQSFYYAYKQRTAPSPSEPLE